MNPDPVHRRRRLILAAALLAMIVIGQDRRPIIGTLSIDLDPIRGIAMHTDASPAVRQAAVIVANAATIFRR